MIEQAAFHWMEPTTYLNGTHIGNSRYIKLPPHLPDPLYICATEMLVQSSAPVSGVDALFNVLLDVGGRHALNVDWPNSEHCSVSDPFCHEQLYRLCMMDFQPGRGRFKRQEQSPVVEYSRSRGDLILVDASGTSTGSSFAIQMCWSLYYLRPGTYTANSGLSALPHSEASLGGFGTWGNTAIGDGRSITPPYYGPDVWFKFTAPVTKALNGIRFRVLVKRSKERCSARLYAADRVTPIAAAGASEQINGAGDWFLPLNGSVTQGTDYWVKITTGALDADIEVCANDANYVSQRGSSTLPNSDDWRVEIL